jgi:hypothetical protein
MKPGPGGGTVVSDADGQFCFQNVQPGEYRFSTSAKGFLASFSSVPISLAAGQSLSDVILHLTPLAAISGRITDEEDKPLAGMQVQLSRVTYLGGQRGLRAENGWSNTDAEGSYRFPGAAPGRYYLSAEPAKTVADDVRYVRSYYPGTPYPEAAAPIDLGPGVELPNLIFKLRKVSTVHVSGHVLSARSADVSLIPEASLFGPGFSTKSALRDGGFDFEGVLPGLYRLRAHLQDGDGREEWASLSISVGAASVEGLRISPLPAPSVMGHIHVDGGEDVADFSKFTVELLPVGRGSGLAGFAGQSDKGGTFRLVGLPPGKFRLRCSYAPPGFYLKAVRAGNRELPDRVFELNTTAMQVEMTMSPKAASVAGSVYYADSDKTVPGAAVVLVPQDKGRKDDRFAYLTATSDRTGGFAIHDVPPGEYKAFAWQAIDSVTNVYMDPDFIAPLETKAVAVTLGEGARANINLTLIAGN